MAKYELLLFDADDTLFDFNKSMRKALSDSLLKIGIVGTAEMQKTYEKINYDCWDKYESGKLSREQMQKARAEEFLDRFSIDFPPLSFNEMFIKGIASCPYVYDGVEKLCKDLSEHYKMAIITNGITSLQRTRIEASSVAGCFENIFVSAEIGCRKPNKAFFDRVFEVYSNTARSKALVIGDTLIADIKGGIDAGTATCFVNDGRAQAGLGTIRADYEVKTAAEIRNILL